ncbi:chitosanase [Noviherbaspirillum saxi]|uniref:Chitosanase n=1 Tax=Noviherbaspirillum saxi TaxID=2320863 RepID=A0A3A3FJR7_9BURK|nr:peptidoglycan-binding protein [Noviherbaspirillum saxi]RJF95743.1 chitosanase [Noviherbaspirillum saxi]
MAVKRARTIPCTDCEDWQEDLSIRGFRVLGCIQDPASPGFCTIVFEEETAQLDGAASNEIAAAVLERPSARMAAPQVEQPIPETIVAALPMLTATQGKAAQAIVNIFETSRVLGDYGQVTVISGDSGHLTYGRTQTTLGSGNLTTLIKQYCVNPGARFGAKLASYIPRLDRKDFSLDADQILHNILRASADDPVMRETQDAFFDQVYWKPALRAASGLGIRTPLGVAVVYDSIIHGSWERMRDRTNGNSGAIGTIGEQKWIAGYVATRKQWMETHTRPDIRATVYRMDAFQRLIDQGFWGLDLPLVVRGLEISADTLSAIPHGCYDGPPAGSRALALESPLARGMDVRLVQVGLSERGVDIKADGVFGQTTAKCIKQFQTSHNLPGTGIADISLIAHLTQ